MEDINLWDRLPQAHKPTSTGWLAVRVTSSDGDPVGCVSRWALGCFKASCTSPSSSCAPGGPPWSLFRTPRAHLQADICIALNIRVYVENNDFYYSLRQFFKYFLSLTSTRMKDNVRRRGRGSFTRQQVRHGDRVCAIEAP